MEKHLHKNALAGDEFERRLYIDLECAGGEYRRRDAVNQDLRSAERGGKLTNQLLAFSRRHDLLTEPVDVNQLISETCEMLPRTIGPTIKIELALDELKTHLRGARIVLRSRTPNLVRQEFYGLLMAHFAIRALMHEAALSADDDPDRLSFIHAVRVIRRKLPMFAAIPPSAAAHLS